MKGRILVVDDDDNLREIICTVLEDAEYDALGAASGAEALAKLHQVERPQLILLDLMMPSMSGYDVRQRLLQEPELASIPVVVMTASRGLDIASLAAAGIVYKPVDVRGLVSAVEGNLASAG